LNQYEYINHYLAEPVVITRHPISDIVPEHQEFVLKCEAVAFPLPRYEWFKDSVVIPDAKIKSLHFEKISVLDSGEYMCKVTNSMGSVYSHVARIQVNPSNILIGMSNLFFLYYI